MKKLHILVSAIVLTLSLIPAGSISMETTTRLTPAAVTVTATKTDMLFSDADMDGKADPGDTLKYTVVQSASGMDAIGVMFSDMVDANTMFVAGSLTASPVAVNDTYPQTVVGNVSVNSSLISYSILTNDFLGLNPAATITAYDATSANGGNVVVNSDGTFTSNPPPGFEGADTFTYTLSSTNGSNTATVSIPVSGMVWFINNAAASCTTLAAAAVASQIHFQP